MAHVLNVIEELREAQRRDGYVTDKALRELAAKLDKPLHELHGVASFYHEFHLKKPPRMAIEVCTALPCQMRNAEGLLRTLQRRAEGRSDVDVRRCPCLGACDTAPAATINGHLQICRSQQDLKELLLNAVAAIEGTREPQPAHPIGIRGKFRIDPYDDASQHYGALKALITGGDYAGVLQKIAAADLRGMGGAGKPASRKWEQVYKEKSQEKYVVCNADESEPGTLKDREMLRNVPHVLVEAMIIGGLTLGAAQGYIYLRHEYKAQQNALEDEISRLRKRLFNGKPLLGEDVGGSGKAFDLKVFTSPGGYIMGEATALLEALEGKRGQPRNQLVDVGMRKGVPSFNGLWGKPTVVNNVETWSYVPCILHKGPEWFAGQGVNGRKGLKWLSVCGDVEAPGVFEVPMGTTYREVIERAGGVTGGWDRLRAFAPSGPTYGFRPPAEVDCPIDFCDPPAIACGSGAIIVLDQSRCMLDAALNFTRFFRNESCGKCAPCRVGSQKMVDLIKDIRAGKSDAGTHRYEMEIRRLEDVLVRMSICGLGQVVPNPILSVLKHWPDEIEAHLNRQQCEAGVCFAAKEGGGMSENRVKTAEAPDAATVSLVIDGSAVVVPRGTTVFEAARQLGISIPALCHLPQMGVAPVGVCRACSVELGGRNFAAACTRECEEGMKVATTSPALEESRKTLVELLLSEHPRPCKRHAETGDCELEVLGEKYGLLAPIERNENREKGASEKPHVAVTREGNLVQALDTLFAPRHSVKPTDTSNLSITVDHGACILCDRCVRACGEIAGHEVIGRTGKGGLTTIGFGNDKPMGSPDSGCVNCGWCMVACPTGAITYSAGVPPQMEPEEDADPGAPLPLEYMKEVALLKESKISPEFLKRSEGGVVVRQYAKGEVICRQGRYGHTAFYIDSGKVDIYLETSLAPIPAKQPSIISRLKDRLRGGGRGEPLDIRLPPSRGRSFIPIDANVSLEVDHPIASLGAGDLFGEAACMTAQPRSATARAAEDGTIVVIMTRNFLDILRRNPRFRARFDQQYRRGVLSNHLRDNALFRDAGVPADYIRALVDRAQLVAFGPGDAIIRQGDEPDAFYLVRLGHVLVTKTFEDGSTLTLNYMMRGQFFGEIGLLLGERRTASCSALDHVELVKIAKDDFEALREAFPAVEQAIRGKAQQRKDWDQARFAQSKAIEKESPEQTGSMDEYLRQQLYEGQSLLVLDLERCTRCDECVRACADAHGGVGRLIREGLRYDKYLVTTTCRSCRDPVCLTQCPVDAIHREGGLPILIENHCIGCESCVNNCPYGNIHTITYEAKVKDFATASWKKQQVKKAVVCDICVDQCLTDGEEPSCVYACPHDAAFRVDGPSFFGLPIIPAHEARTVKT